MTLQSNLGPLKIHRLPNFTEPKMGRVTSTRDYSKYGRIEVVFLDYGVPCPVWVIGDIDREPVEGDMVLIGYMEGRGDRPYLIGYMKNSSYSTNFIQVKKDLIRVQLPIHQIEQDVSENLLDDSKQDQRAYMELTPTHSRFNFPTSSDGSTPPAYIEITAGGINIYHPTGNVEVQLPLGDLNVTHPVS